jgi:hypothetical protein
METVRERDEAQAEGEGRIGSRARGPRMRVMGRWCKLSLLRFWWMQTLCIACALAMVVVVGVVVFRSALSNKRQEIHLKCENRKQVSTHTGLKI